MSVKLFIVFLYCPFNGYWICGDIRVIPDNGDLFILPFYILSFSRGLFFFFPQRTSFSFIDFLYRFPLFNSTDFYSLSFPSCCLLWVYFVHLFLVSWGRNLGHWFETFFFSNVSTSCYIFPSQLHLTCIPQTFNTFSFSVLYKGLF